MRRRILPAVLLALVLLAPSAASARVWTLNGQPIVEEGFGRAIHAVQSFVHRLISTWAHESVSIIPGG